MKISFSDVQRNISEIANRQEYTIDVLYELMAAYGRSASSITKLRNGIYNLAEEKDSAVLQKGVVYFKIVSDFESLPAEVEKLEQDPLTQRYNPRFLVATDLKTIAAKDIKKGNTLEIAWADIDRNADFFYGWTGDEVTDEKTEAVADRRAADKMKELYQEVEKVNLDKFKDSESNFRHHLNVFFARLLFCFFAEDTGVFTKEDDNIFTNAIKDFTQTDGSDLDKFLSTLFESLDEEDKSAYTSPYSKFPYVNGKLFGKSFSIEIPKFNAQARKLILDCGALGWAEINPDIFGSMFQSIVDEDHRSTHGMHYTSVPNIMKTIEPLFLDELREEFDEHYNNPKKLQKLHDRISKIKVFDPACGSGNFLIIAYKELRKLEHGIIERLFADEYHAKQLKNKLQSRIDLNNFYGIEIDDFASEVAMLSLYLAKHQMNIEFEKQFGKEIKLIPLKDKANIVHGNAARLDWQNVCLNKPTKHSLVTEQQDQLIVTEDKIDCLPVEEEWTEIYLIGNPPYEGGKKQNKTQKEDLEIALNHKNHSKNLDYISIWFIKGAEYIKGSGARLAFVSTNSVAQGDHVSLLWQHIDANKIEIHLAYTSFEWSNSARNNAGITCVIIGFRNIDTKEKKFIFTDGLKKEVENINYYLRESVSNTIIGRRNEPISQLPIMVSGSMPRDGGHLILNREEKNSLIENYSDAIKFVKKYIGAAEYIKGEERYCLWISKSDITEAIQIKPIKERLDKVKESRLDSRAASTRKFADKPYRFVQISYRETYSILVPKSTSHRRDYLPIGYVDKDTVISDLSFAIYDAEHWLFALLSSRMHTVWIDAVAGRLRTGYRYSNTIVYNNFPARIMTPQQKTELNSCARAILFARENHTERTIAEMYNPDKMPDDLREAHHKNDLLVEKLYRQKPYSNDEERLADLFKLYEEITAKEEN